MKSKKEQTDRMVSETVHDVNSSSKPKKRPWKSPVIIEENYRNTEWQSGPGLPGAPDYQS